MSATPSVPSAAPAPSVAPARRSPEDMVARRVRDIPPSGIRRFFDLVIGMDDVCSLGVGEPDFPTPDVVAERGIREIRAHHTTYTSNHGLMELRETICTWLRGKYGVDYDPATETMITVGASEGIDLVLRAVLEPGDEVIVVEPCYVSYAPTVVLAGGVAVPFATWQHEDFKLDLTRLRAAITPRTKVLMLNYPSNPTGNTFDRADLEALAALVIQHDLLVVSDEIYAELSYDAPHQSLCALPGMKDHAVLVSGFSKSHAMTGWRLGYLCAPPALLAACVKIHQFTMLCAPTISQYAGIDALKYGEDAVAAMRAEYHRRRDLIVSGFNGLGIKTLSPGGAFYAFGNIAGLGFDNSSDFCDGLLKAEKVAVVPGDAFGESGALMIRACYASSVAKIETALERMGRFLGKA